MPTNPIQTTGPGEWMTRGSYRIDPAHGGYEAQMLYPCGAVPRDEWFPLNADGYWSDPDAYSFGLISKRNVFATQAEAAAAIRNARAINGEAVNA